MDKLASLKLRDLALRVSDRDLELNFYHNLLGLDILSEENATVFLGIKDNKDVRLVIEETPEASSVAPEIPRLHAFSMRTASLAELLAILHRLKDTGHLPYFACEGKSAYGFRVADYEQNRIQIYYSPDQSSNEFSSEEIKETTIDELLKNLPKNNQELPTDLAIDSLKLNVKSMAESSAFYQKLFATPVTNQTLPIIAGHKPFNLLLKEVGDQLATEPGDQSLDLEYLEFYLSSADQKKLIAHLNSEKIAFNQVDEVIVVTDPTGIEWWFVNEEKRS